MKIILIFAMLLSCFQIALNNDAKCKDEGCYEVIKTLAELLEQRIKETDKLLAEAESQLNEVTFGNDEKFKNAIGNVDKKLTHLLVEIFTGIDGGNRTLLEIINQVFGDVNKIENDIELINVETEGIKKKESATKGNMKDIHEIVKEIQEDLVRLQNATTVEGPEALQNAFDKSEKFSNDTKELKNVLNEVKSLLIDYEKNLINAKELTQQTIQRFANVSEVANETMKIQDENDENLKKQPEGFNGTAIEFENIKKIAKESLDKARDIYEEAFDLLNDVTKLDLDLKLDKIIDTAKNLSDHANVIDKSLKDFAEESEKFLLEMEQTLDQAENIKKRSSDYKKKIEDALKTINGTNEIALKAIADMDATIDNAKNIYKTLQDFSNKVERSSESARIALEKIPEILQRVQESVKIVENLENKMENYTKTATDVKETCGTVKSQMEGISNENESIKNRVEGLQTNSESLSNELKIVAGNLSTTSDEVEKLLAYESADEVIIANAKEKIERTKQQIQQTDKEIEKVLERINSIMKELDDLKDIDHAALDDFDRKITEAENDLNIVQLSEKLKNLQLQHHHQQKTIEQYKVEISELEYGLSVIKKNANSLENKCFKRTRLEP